MWFGGICFGNDKENHDEKNYAGEKYIRDEENICFIFDKIYHTKEKFDEKSFGIVHTKEVVGEIAEKYAGQRESGRRSEGKAG